MKIITQAYGQFLINGVDNFTATYFLEIVEGLKADNPKYRSVKDLPWDSNKLQQGSVAKLKACSLKLKLFRLMVHSNRTDDYIVTNDNEAICTPQDAIEPCVFRWKIE